MTLADAFCVFGAFRRAVAAVPGVQSVVIEVAQGDVVHVTTSANPVTEDVRREVYAAEVEAVQAAPDLVFDFHLRLAPEAKRDTSSTASFTSVVLTAPFEVTP